MIRIRKNIGGMTPKEVEEIKKSSSSSSSGSPAATQSPFAAKPLDALRSITERKSRSLTEEQKLALLQRALEPFANEARSHLPHNLSDIEQKMRRKMLERGFSKEVATEAGDETVTVLLDKSQHKKVEQI